MKAKEFIQRFSTKTRVLSGFCDGIVVHLVRGGDRWFGGVVDGDEAWLVPFHSHFAALHFYWSAEVDLSDAVASWLVENTEAA